MTPRASLKRAYHHRFRRRDLERVAERQAEGVGLYLEYVNGLRRDAVGK